MKPRPCRCKRGIPSSLLYMSPLRKEGLLPPRSGSKSAIPLEDGSKSGIPSEDGQAHPRAQMQRRHQEYQDQRDNKARAPNQSQDNNKRVTPKTATKPRRLVNSRNLRRRLLDGMAHKRHRRLIWRLGQNRPVTGRARGCPPADHSCPSHITGMSASVRFSG
jgi:hypothetical protein